MWLNNDEEKNEAGQTVKLILPVQTDFTIQVKCKIPHSSKEIWCSHQTLKLYLNQQLSYSQSWHSLHPFYFFKVKAGEQRKCFKLQDEEEMRVKDSEVVEEREECDWDKTNNVTND